MIKKLLFISLFSCIETEIQCSKAAKNFSANTADNSFNKDEIISLLKSEHKAFAAKKNSLAQQKKQGLITDQEFKKLFQEARDNFNEITKNIKASIPKDMLYGFKKAEEKIKENRKKQNEEESIIESQYLSGPKAYNPRALAKERKEIEEANEFEREIIRLFTKDPIGDVQKHLTKLLDQAKKEFKNAQYSLRTLYIPEGQETYENHLVFKKNQQEMGLQYQKMRDLLINATENYNDFVYEFLNNKKTDSEILSNRSELTIEQLDSISQQLTLYLTNFIQNATMEARHKALSKITQNDDEQEEAAEHSVSQEGPKIVPIPLITIPKSKI